MLNTFRSCFETKVEANLQSKQLDKNNLPARNISSHPLKIIYILTLARCEMS